MNSLRPLITITILAVVGAYLYVKINEGPARPAHGDAAAWQDQTAEGVPPLAATTGAPPAAIGSAPQWPDATAIAPPVQQFAADGTAADNTGTAAAIPSASPNADTGLPDMPAIPELPDVPSPSEATPPASASNSVSVNLPANIPSARYPNETAGNDSATNAARSDASAIGSVPVATPQTTPQSTADHESTIATDNAMAAVGLTPQLPAANATVSDSQAPPAQQPAPGSDRYGLGAANSIDRSLPDAATPPVEPTFTDAWAVIQTALDRGELARAHQLLSQWYGDDSLTPAEAEKVETLLGQLAGTVVYSTEHQLEPAHVVRPGETLDSIAKQCNVPWQLLAKINGISAADAVQPGQQLKVVRGPFSAVVDLRRSQLTLMLDGRYAGKFPITVPTGATVTEGRWLVDQKLALPSAGVIQSAYAPAAAVVDRAIVLKGEDASTGKPAATGPTLTIASGSSPAGPSASSPAIRLSPQDAEELSDILSVGSRVTIRK